MEIPAALRRIVAGGRLRREEMRALMLQVMSGNATEAQIGGLLMALCCRGETAEEITGAAEVMRQLAVRVPARSRPLVDVCGTGGSGMGLFNVSTAVAFVVAAAGGHVAKHGNRALSSKSGSADLLEQAGAVIDLSPEDVARCIDTLGMGFMLAPLHHTCMRHAAGPRKELGVRTLFNLLGPLTNPAGVQRQMIGVFAAQWQEPIAMVLAMLGSEQALVVHCDGLDELGLSAPTSVVEMRAGDVESYGITPEDVGLQTRNHSGLQAAGPEHSLALVQAALTGDGQGLAGDAVVAARDIVALNSGAALYVGGLSTDIRQGVEWALELLASGRAYEKFLEFIALTRSLRAGKA